MSAIFRAGVIALFKGLEQNEFFTLVVSTKINRYKDDSKKIFPERPQLKEKLEDVLLEFVEKYSKGPDVLESVDFLDKKSKQSVLDEKFMKNGKKRLQILNDQVFIPEHLKIPYFLFPKGKIEKGETPVDAAIRECVEEAGIEFELDENKFVDFEDIRYFMAKRIISVKKKYEERIRGLWRISF